MYTILTAGYFFAILTIREIVKFLMLCVVYILMKEPWGGTQPRSDEDLIIFLISTNAFVRLSINQRDLFQKTLARYFDPTHATVQLAPTMASKLNTAVQLSLVAGTLAAPVFHFIDHPILQGLWYLTAATTVAGGLSYLVSKNTYKLLRKKKITERQSS